MCVISHVCQKLWLPCSLGSWDGSMNEQGPVTRGVTVSSQKSSTCAGYRTINLHLYHLYSASEWDLMNMGLSFGGGQERNRHCVTLTPAVSSGHWTVICFEFHFVATTLILNAAFFFCYRVMVMSEGKIKEFDTPGALTADAESLFYKMAKDAGLIWQSMELCDT